MSKDLPKIKDKKSKRVGRGFGSGRGGHTSGRGMKGQKSRSKRHILFEGFKVKKSFIKRLPFQRGKGKFKPKSDKPLEVKLSELNALPSGSKVNVENLIKHGIVEENDAQDYGVKILGNGHIDKKLTLEVPATSSAIKKIEKAGGEIKIK